MSNKLITVRKGFPKRLFYTGGTTSSERGNTSFGRLARTAPSIGAGFSSAFQDNP